MFFDVDGCNEIGCVWVKGVAMGVWGVGLFVKTKKTSALSLDCADVIQNRLDLGGYLLKGSPKNNVPKLTAYAKTIVAIFEMMPHMVLF